ncbi:MAG: hypothetical protein AMS18_12665 [Gemmatimonas sp. SG8_17]|nr:MAG: hypothetical protein AMS18_12665 [Gemmatimonas sp. SG8_17]
MTSRRDPIGPGQESVWDYPRPPRVEDFPGRIRIVFSGKTIVDTTRAKRVLETSHPPVYYIPPDDIDPQCLKSAAGESWCEWKGVARYFDVEAGNASAPRAAWYYPHPTPDFVSIASHVAFYSGSMDACYVNDELVRQQPGDFYGGWITNNIVGPFKGGPGTKGW